MRPESVRLTKTTNDSGPGRRRHRSGKLMRRPVGTVAARKADPGAGTETPPIPVRRGRGLATDAPPSWGPDGL